jgi:hypothetical protein
MGRSRANDSATCKHGIRARASDIPDDQQSV